MPGGATTAAADPIILEAIGKRYETGSGAVQAVDSVSLTVRAEEFVTLLGPSGCGKSTVLGMIAGLVRPDAGRVLVAGVPCVGPNPEQVARSVAAADAAIARSASVRQLPIRTTIIGGPSFLVGEACRL